MIAYFRINKQIQTQTNTNTYLSEFGVRKLGTNGIFKLLTKRSSTGFHNPNGAQVILLRLRRLRNRQHDRRNHRSHRDFTPLHQLQKQINLELGHDQDGRANSKPTQHDRVQSIDMEHGQDTEYDVIAVEVEVRVLSVDLLGDARDQPLVGQHHSFGQTRRAGGVRKRHHVVGRYFHGVDLLRRLGQLGEPEAALRDRGRLLVGAYDHDAVVLEVLDFVDVARLGDDELRVRGFGLFRDLRRGEKRVRGGRGGAAERGGEEREDELGAVREEDHHDVVSFDAEFLKTGGDPTGCHVDVGVSVHAAGGTVD